MKLIRTEDAVGQVLCHDITQIIPGVVKDAVFRKGHIVQPEDIPVLLSVGKDHLYVWENDETKRVYPFDFALSVTHRFVNNGFETRYTVENHSSRVMPFVIGGHPGFASPMNEGEVFSLSLIHI